jgi:Ca-activated chloride channel family protein
MVSAAAFNMMQPWVGLISVAAVLLAVALVSARRRMNRRSAHEDDAAPIANVFHAEASLVFQRLRRRYRSLVGVEVASLSLVGLAAIGLTMRPLSEHRDDREVSNRDVMLCLDVSGSMIQLDVDVLASFATLTAGLEGERIGLTIFNGSAVSVFPLTDDARYVADTLAASATLLVEHKQLFTQGTNEGGSSLIGDGLASCVLRFDRLDQRRSRSIVFVTDNMRAGSPIMTVEEAGDFASERDIRVYAIAAEHTPEFAGITLADVATGTGGAAFQMTDTHTVDAVISEIQALEATRIQLPTDVVADDRPTFWIALCLFGVSGAALAHWTLRR